MARFTVIEQPRYLEQMRKTESETWRSDEHRSTVKHILERMPSISEEISASAKLYMMHVSREFEGRKPIAVFYFIDGDTVYLEEAYVDTSEEEE